MLHALRRLFHDYHAAGAPNSLLGPTAFIDGATLLMKGGDLALFYRLNGVDYEGADHGDRAFVSARVDQASRSLDERFSLTYLLFKRRVAPFVAPPCAHPAAAAAIDRYTARLNATRSDRYTIDLYAVILLRGAVPITSSRLRVGAGSPWKALQAWLSPVRVVSLMNRDLVHAVGHLHHAAHAWATGLADTVRPVRLPAADAYTVLRRLVNPAPHKVAQPLTRRTQIDRGLTASEWRFFDDHLEIDGWRIKLLTMMDPPTPTFAHLFEGLYAVPGEWTACLDWRAWGPEEMRTRFATPKRQYAGQAHQRPVGAGAETGVLLTDESAEASALQIGKAMTEGEVEGVPFGDCALTMALQDRDPHALDQSVAAAINVMAHRGGQFMEETYNGGFAWLAMVPGNHAYQKRALPLSSHNMADMSFVFTLDRGDPMNAHLSKPALAVLETRSGTPYHFNLHVGDLGHGIILAPPGEGKSYLGNFLVMHAQQYDPLTVIFDIGRSYRKLSHALGGSFLDVGRGSAGVRLNPFAMAPTETNWNFQSGFVQVLLEGAGQPKLSGPDRIAVFDAVKNVSVHDPENRRLATLRWQLPPHLAPRLTPWLKGGRYGHLFDHVEDTLTLARLQVFEFESVHESPDVLDPLLFYVLHRVTAALGQQFTFVLMDEAWKFIQHPTIRTYVHEASKTWRKHNAALWLISQAVEDFAALDQSMRGNCPTRILLVNPRLARPDSPDRPLYAQAFGLNDGELDTIAGLQRRREIFIKLPHLSKVARLDVDPESHAIYSLDPYVLTDTTKHMEVSI